MNIYNPKDGKVLRRLRLSKLGKHLYFINTEGLFVVGYHSGGWLPRYSFILEI